MASGGPEMKTTFKKFATKGDKSEATSKDMTKWCKDAGVFGKACSSNNMDIAFSSVKPKGKTTITMKELDPLINALAKSYMKDKSVSEDDAKTQIKEKLIAADPDFKSGVTKISSTGGVKKMTDTKQYTGAHKERFAEDGTGKGKSGREDIASTTGYVGNYKDEGTFDAKAAKK